MSIPFHYLYGLTSGAEREQVPKEELDKYNEYEKSCIQYKNPNNDTIITLINKIKKFYSDYKVELKYKENLPFCFISSIPDDLIDNSLSDINNATFIDNKYKYKLMREIIELSLNSKIFSQDLCTRLKQMIGVMNKINI